MKTTYDTKLEILDDAIPALNVIAHLVEAHNLYINTIGTNKNMDESAACFLAEAIRDISSGIEKFLDKGRKADEKTV
jgi:hypothetical protein